MDQLSEENIYIYDEESHMKILDNKPWLRDETYFNKVMISTLAAIKIVDHAIKGGKKEICGYITGFVKERTFYVLDAIELPIIGTDARVEVAGELGDQMHINIFKTLDLYEKVGRPQKLVGWYHSHPGLGCWLSGIDVRTQKMMQLTNKTFFALVVDPWKTLSNRKIEFGCYMCFQKEKGEDYVPDVSDIPLYKAEDFGYHANCYYTMPHSFFQSKFEEKIIKLIYKNYSMDTLGSNILLTNDNYNNEIVNDLSAKVKNYQLLSNTKFNLNEKQNEIHQKKLNYIVKANTQISVGLQNELVKNILFNDN